MQWFRAEPEARQKCDIELYMHLLEDVKSRMEKGTIQDCLAAQTISEMPKNGMTDLEVAYAVSSPFGAGIETVSPTELPIPFLLIPLGCQDCRDVEHILPYVPWTLSLHRR